MSGLTKMLGWGSSRCLNGSATWIGTAGEVEMRRRAPCVARVLLGAALPLPLLACATVASREPVLQEFEVATDEDAAAFEAAGERFSTPSSCREHLIELTAAFPRDEYGIVRGPYAVFDNDVRIHAITARKGQYVVVEYRCLGASIEGRSWAAGPAGEEPQPFTLEDIQAMTFPREAEDPAAEEPR